MIIYNLSGYLTVEEYYVAKDIECDRVWNSHHSSQCDRGVYYNLHNTIEYLSLSSYRCSSNDIGTVYHLVSLGSDSGKIFLKVI